MAGLGIDKTFGLEEAKVSLLTGTMLITAFIASFGYSSASHANENCARTLSTLSFSQSLPLSPTIISLPSLSRTSLAFDVQACGEVRVTLVVADVTMRKIRGDIVEVVIESIAERIATSILDCKQGSCVVNNVSTISSDENCTEHKSFAIDWKGVIRVDAYVNSTWQTVTTSSTATQMSNTSSVQNLFVTYFGQPRPNGSDSDTAQWRIRDALCELSPTDGGTVVPISQHVGVVIAVLICGIVFGCFCSRLYRRVSRIIRKKCRPKRDKTESKHDTHQEELNVLVAVQPGEADSGTDATARLEPLLLPKESAPSGEGRVTNTYTPYSEMSGPAKKATSVTDDSKPDSRDVPVNAEGDVTRKTDEEGALKWSGGRRSEGSTGGRAVAPLPSLPGHYRRGASAPFDVSTYIMPDPDDASEEENYANAEAHVYEGVHHGAAIYENRDVGFYESLRDQKPAKATGK